MDGAKGDAVLLEQIHGPHDGGRSGPPPRRASLVSGVPSMESMGMMLPSLVSWLQKASSIRVELV